MLDICWVVYILSLPDDPISRGLGCSISLIAQVNDSNKTNTCNCNNISLEVWDMEDLIDLMTDDVKFKLHSQLQLTIELCRIGSFRQTAELWLLTIEAHIWLKHPQPETHIWLKLHVHSQKRILIETKRSQSETHIDWN